MLYLLLTSLTDEFSPFQRLPLPDDADRPRHPHGASVRLLVWAADHLPPQGEAGARSADPHRWAAASHRREAGHADHGRADDPVRHLRRHAAVGRSRQSLCLGRAVRDAGFWRNRLLRRFPEGDEGFHEGLFRQGAAAGGVPDCGRAVAIFMWIGQKPLATSLAVPFFKDVLIPFGIFFIFVGMFVVVGAAMP